VRLEAIIWDRLGDLLDERLLELKPGEGGPWARVGFHGAAEGERLRAAPRRCLRLRINASS